MASDLAPFRVDAGEVPAHVTVRAHSEGFWILCRHCCHSVAIYHFALMQRPELLEHSISEHRNCA